MCLFNLDFLIIFIKYVSLRLYTVILLSNCKDCICGIFAKYCMYKPFIVHECFCFYLGLFLHIVFIRMEYFGVR